MNYSDALNDFNTREARTDVRCLTVLGLMLRNVRLTYGANRRERTVVVVLYKEKSYLPSGKSIKGVVEMSSDDLLLRCHECGGRHANLAVHIAEQITAREYKLKHGLTLRSSLVNEPMRLIRASAQSKAFGDVEVHGIELTEVGAVNAEAPQEKWEGEFTRMGAMNARRTWPVQALHDLRALIESAKQKPTYF